jgi:hypothetical protein
MPKVESIGFSSRFPWDFSSNRVDVSQPKVSQLEYVIPLHLWNHSGNENVDGELGAVDTWLRLLVAQLYDIGGVESIHFAKIGTTADVWVLIPKRDLGLVRGIVETAHGVARIFSVGESDQLFISDIHTVYREGRQATDLLPLYAVQLPRP